MEGDETGSVSNCEETSANYEFILNPVNVQESVRFWLKEDIPSFDYGGFVVGETVQKAVILCKSPGVLAGVPFVTAVLNELNCTIEWFAREGSCIDPKPAAVIAHVKGKVRHLLLAERVALNCLSRASGIATTCRQLKRLAEESEWKGEIAGTRKTTPGFRIVEKYALLVGGLSTHRYDLSSMVMLKDNHILSAGNITKAVKDARKVAGFSLKIEVECRSCTAALQAATAGCDIVMLDNFKPQALHDAAMIVKGKHPNVLVEASGGINERNISEYFGRNVDIISLSKTTQGYQAVDFSFKIHREGHNPANPQVT